MCLITKQIEPKVATEDITCYKVLNLLNNGEYHTPYYDTFIPSEIIEGKKTLKPELKRGETFFDKKLNIEGNCIHSYATEKESLNGISPFREVFECVIPKGALYYEGYNKEYASSEIRFVKKIAGRKEVEKVLSLEDIGYLDWDVDKDIIINVFSDYGFLYDNKCYRTNYDTTVYEEEYKVPSELEKDDEPIVTCGEEGREVTEEEKAQTEEVKKKNEALSYRLYLAIKYIEENKLENAEIIMPIVRRIFDQEPEVIIDIKQALDLYNFYFNILKPLQKTCRIDTEATACAIAAQKLIGKESTIVEYLKGVIESCNTALSKITD